MEQQAGAQPFLYNWSLSSDWTRALPISAFAAFEKQCEALREYSEIMAGWAARREEALRNDGRREFATNVTGGACCAVAPRRAIVRDLESHAQPARQFHGRFSHRRRLAAVP